MFKSNPLTRPISERIRLKANEVLHQEGYSWQRLGQSTFAVTNPSGTVYSLDWVGTNAAYCSCPARGNCAHLVAMERAKILY